MCFAKQRSRFCGEFQRLENRIPPSAGIKRGPGPMRGCVFRVACLGPSAVRRHSISKAHKKRDPRLGSRAPKVAFQTVRPRRDRTMGSSIRLPSQRQVATTHIISKRAPSFPLTRKCGSCRNAIHVLGRCKYGASFRAAANSGSLYFSITWEMCPAKDAVIQDQIGTGILELARLLSSFAAIARDDASPTKCRTCNAPHQCGIVLRASLPHNGKEVKRQIG